LGFWANELGAVDDVALTSDILSFLPGDYDHNGSVGEEDFDKWRTTFGQSVTPGADADGNGNGTIDAADYTFWRDILENPGSGAAAGFSTAAVPEPHGIVLGGLAGLLSAGTLRRRRK